MSRGSGSATGQGVQTGTPRGGGVVCYIERELGGVLIRRVRLVAVGLMRTWSAPELGSAAGIEAGAGAGQGPALARSRAAAKWVAATLQGAGLKRLASVCVDVDGSICAWLSAPSPDPTVIGTFIQHATQESGSETASLGAGRLFALASSSNEPGGGGGFGLLEETSFQALATASSTPMGAINGNGHGKGKPRLALKRETSPGPSGARQRYAVLAVPDAPIRVFLDELDALGIQTQQVQSLWHGLASAWDPPVRAGASRQPAGASRAEIEYGAVIDAEQPTVPTAIVLVEPAGRLVWAWSRNGELVAGGTMRLHSIPVAATESAGKSEASTELATREGEHGEGARRVEGSGAGGAAQPPALEFTPAEVGRLAMDWLSWSAQLGHCPARIVCLAPPGLGNGSGVGPEALARGLTRAWPGAVVDAAVVDDPVAATLARLAGLGPAQEEVMDLAALNAKKAAAPKTQAEASPSPRQALVGLTSRPGRVHRGMYRWAAAGLLAASVLVCVLGWRLHQSAGKAEAEIKAANAAFEKTKAEVEPIVPTVKVARVPVDEVQTKVSQLREQALKIRPPRPVIQETVRLLQAVAAVAKPTRVVEFDMNSFSGKVTINVPDADTGPAILEKLNKSKGVMNWQGTIPTFRTDAQRQYILIGLWPSDEKLRAAETGGGS